MSQKGKFTRFVGVYIFPVAFCRGGILVELFIGSGVRIEKNCTRFLSCRTNSWLAYASPICMGFQ